MTDAEAVLERVLAAHGAALGRLARTYTDNADDAQDLLQEIAVALWRALPSWRGDASERTFVFRVAHNRGLSFRAARRRSAVSLDQAAEPPDPAAPADEAVQAADRAERLRRAVARLPAAWQQVVMLRLEGLADREIAAIVGISEGNVAVRLTRARRALRDLLGGIDP